MLLFEYTNRLGNQSESTENLEPSTEVKKNLKTDVIVDEIRTKKSSCKINDQWLI